MVETEFCRRSCHALYDMQVKLWRTTSRMRSMIQQLSLCNTDIRKTTREEQSRSGRKIFNALIISFVIRRLKSSKFEIFLRSSFQSESRSNMPVVGRVR